MERKDHASGLVGYVVYLFEYLQKARGESVYSYYSSQAVLLQRILLVLAGAK